MTTYRFEAWGHDMGDIQGNNYMVMNKLPEFMSISVGDRLYIEGLGACLCIARTPGIFEPDNDTYRDLWLTLAIGYEGERIKIEEHFYKKACGFVERYGEIVHAPPDNSTT
jgi:hypothetical protein